MTTNQRARTALPKTKGVGKFVVFTLPKSERDALLKRRSLVQPAEPLQLRKRAPADAVTKRDLDEFKKHIAHVTAQAAITALRSIAEPQINADDPVAAIKSIHSMPRRGVPSFGE